MTGCSRNSRNEFRIASENTVISYSVPLFVTTAMVLRFIHAIVTDQMADYGDFRLRGNIRQFQAGVALYQLLLATDGQNLDAQADWAIHHFFTTLLCPLSSDDRAVSYPMEQAQFLWSFLGDHRYKISGYVHSFLTATKYCLRCIAIHNSRIQARQNRQPEDPFFDKLPSPAAPQAAEHKGHSHAQAEVLAIFTEDEDDEDMTIDKPEETVMDINAALLRLSDFQRHLAQNSESEDLNSESEARSTMYE
jgi:hypothetical protein